MSNIEISLRIFGRDLTLACPPKEKENLIKAAKLLNEELDNINDKNNALIIAGLTLANKLLTNNPNSNNVDNIDYSKIIKKIENVLEK
ncbi:MAG: cell division protein ZapA [SAR86 cluster bacterium]|jgi:cell division protein ZapA (FtsZ GTPase activity inhibitor)|uniref:Cell division protein ZapA n=1 Tax=SAR86 cluster bacterium TaxID=2030880 RepID=A0A520MWS4_9GAMM|nr:MAG: cell division protein ZapA [SAR86 cluster bacterium]|tara:strand:- start:243 stop:506 length:264 start_codon:yes stop_codon:yes gene_type:complete